MKISVITPSFNQGQYLEETITSVINQTHDDIEHLVFDGGSTDNSVELLEKYKDYLWYRSGKDNGQTAAINEGFQRATGEVLTWLNSDDLFFDETTLAQVAARFDQDPALDALFGDFVITDPGGNIISHKKQVGYDYNCLLYGYCYITPTIFIRRATLERFGALDDTFRYIFDWEYYLRLGRQRARIGHLKVYLFRHRFHRDSITVSMPEKQINEIRRMREKYEHRLLMSETKTRLAELYYRARSWVLRFVCRGQLSLPLSHRWIPRRLS